MYNLQYLILALVQGVTEFIPVSSSGHLAFFQQILGFEEPMLVFDLLLHLATTLAVIVFLRKELSLLVKESFIALKSCRQGRSFSKIWQELPFFRMSIFVISALLPAIILGVTMKTWIEKMFTSLTAVGISFIFTGLILFFTRQVISRREIGELNIKDSFFIGVAQAIAIVPGISRSGMTISAGIFRGLDKNLAAKFSFILSIPTILAAVVYKLKDGPVSMQISSMNMLISFIAAFFSGYAALMLLSRMVARAKFYYFSYYCWLMGVVSIMLGMKRF